MQAYIDRINSFIDELSEECKSIPELADYYSSRHIYYEYYMSAIAAVILAKECNNAGITDLGCGYGSEVILYNLLGVPSIGIEADKKRVVIAKRRFLKYRPNHNMLSAAIIHADYTTSLRQLKRPCVLTIRQNLFYDHVRPDTALCSLFKETHAEYILVNNVDFVLEKASILELFESSGYHILARERISDITTKPILHGRTDRVARYLLIVSQTKNTLPFNLTEMKNYIRQQRLKDLSLS